MSTQGGKTDRRRGDLHPCADQRIAVCECRRGSERCSSGGRRPVYRETPDPNADETLLLDVQVNGHPIGKIGEFTLRRGKLLARPEELRDLGFRIPASLVTESGGLVALSVVPGLTWTLDQKEMELYVKVSDSGLVPALLGPSVRGELTGRRVIESGTGLTLNYDTVGSFATGQGGGAGGTGSMDMRAFSPLGIVSSGWLAYAGTTSGGPGTNTAIRLDSAYTFADVNTLRRYSLGDFITGGLAWTRPVRMEGAQIHSDFSMRPDLITFPLPTISGSAAVPSTVDVLANGNLVVSSQTDAGPFEIPQLPVVSGAGTISMTVTNSLGQQVTVTQPFYASSTLLAPGLQTFAVQAGLVRRNWGSVSNDYGKIAGAAIYRRGLTPMFTVEGSVEGTPGAVHGGRGRRGADRQSWRTQLRRGGQRRLGQYRRAVFRRRAAHRQGLQPGRFGHRCQPQLPRCGVDERRRSSAQAAQRLHQPVSQAIRLRRRGLRGARPGCPSQFRSG